MEWVRLRMYARALRVWSGKALPTVWEWVKVENTLKECSTYTVGEGNMGKTLNATPSSVQHWTSMLQTLKEWSTYTVGEGNMGIVLNGSLTTLQTPQEWSTYAVGAGNMGQACFKRVKSCTTLLEDIDLQVRQLCTRVKPVLRLRQSYECTLRVLVGMGCHASWWLVQHVRSAAALPTVWERDQQHWTRVNESLRWGKGCAYHAERPGLGQ
ncbi:hypothetical protein CPB85DRAFT_1463505 [Mucidula mucida]|nr:hypothetical protein CPB85DRAFT_1463505 [Mucidula mucida]